MAPKTSSTKTVILMPTLHSPPVLGGFEIFMQNLAERVPTDCEMIVVTGQVAGAPKKEVKGNLTIYRDASLYPLSDLSGSSWLYMLTTLPMLVWRSFYLTFKHKVNVLHGIGFFGGLICLKLCYLTGKSYVMTIQSADFNIYHPEATGSTTWVHDWFERWIYKKASRHHAVSNDLCKHYERQGVAGKCDMIPNGIDTQKYYPVSGEEKEKIRRKYNLPKDKFLAVNISRLEWKNGVADSIKALVKLPDVSLVVIGDGSLRGKLKELVKELKLDDQVFFMGQIPFDEVGPLAASCDLFIRVPLAEGFGISFLEGLATGIPVIGTNTGGVPDIIQSGANGLLVEPGDVEEISNAIKTIKDDGVLRDKFVANGLKVIKEKYDWGVISSQIYNLFRSV